MRRWSSSAANDSYISDFFYLPILRNPSNLSIFESSVAGVMNLSDAVGLFPKDFSDAVGEMADLCDTVARICPVK